MSFRTLYRKSTKIIRPIWYAYWKGAEANCFPIGKYGLFGTSALSPKIAQSITQKEGQREK